MGRKLVSIHDFNHALELLEKSRDQLRFLIGDQLDFLDSWRRYTAQMASALSWIRTLEYWIHQYRKEIEGKG